MALKRHGFARRRRAAGFTQEALAEALSVERSTVVRWESGRATPQPYLWPRLAALLKVSTDELGELLVQPAAGPSAMTERTAYAMRHPLRADLMLVAELQDGMKGLAERYDRVPSVTLLAQAGHQVNQLGFLADGAPAGRVQRELRLLQADASTLMGQLVWDASQRHDHRSARAHYAQSVDVARLLRHRASEGHALLRMCHVTLYGAGDYREGLSLALRAADTARSTSHVLTGLSLLHAAEAHAYLGAGQDCTRHLIRAERELELVTGSDSAYDLSSPTHFGRLAGSCFLSLGDYRKAREYLAETAVQLRDRRKSRAIVLGNLALTWIREGELDAALDAFNDAVNELHGTRGGGGMNVAFRAARELRRWRDEPAVQEAQDHLLALMETA
ncbi:helix-turn-helix transcriptional regulator [Streptomyces alboflavus]|uniref:helix-turn-helix transcriptional regulator n=1 Tax=Streptomyces alboflavus TaxID=67267 RepID=UPI0004BF869E|nr:helix-turn-helix transcriptional regulator [Streptomyces alboflavus]